MSWLILSLMCLSLHLTKKRFDVTSLMQLTILQFSRLDSSFFVEHCLSLMSVASVAAATMIHCGGSPSALTWMNTMPQMGGGGKITKGVGFISRSNWSEDSRPQWEVQGVWGKLAWETRRAASQAGQPDFDKVHNPEKYAIAKLILDEQMDN